MISRRSIPAAGGESPANGARPGTTSTPHTPSIIKGVAGLGFSGIPQLRTPLRAGGGVRSCGRRGDRGAGQPAGRDQAGAGRAAWTQGPHSHAAPAPAPAPAPALGGRGLRTGPDRGRARAAARWARPRASSAPARVSARRVACTSARSYSVRTLELLIDPRPNRRGGTAARGALVVAGFGWNHYLMSPAGCGSAWFRGARDARIDRSRWMLPWLFPVGLLGTVALASLSTVFGFLLLTVWGWLVFPSVALYISSRSHSGQGASSRNALRDADADYWRTRLM